MIHKGATVLAAFALAGCMVGPDYRRPDYPTPATFRGMAPAAQTGPGSLGDLEWWNVFEDEQLQALIRSALGQNYDIRIAATRILDARAQVIIARSFLFPTIDAGAAANETQLNTIAGSRLPPSSPRENFTTGGGLDLAWEVDFWGRIRRSTEAARADLLAAEEARRTVILTLIGDVAQAYLSLRALDAGLEIAKATLASRQESLRLVQAREEGGVASLMDVRQAESLVESAAEAIPDFERQIAQTENQISVLLGQNPQAIPRGRPLTEQLALPSLPPGLTTALLQRRPDIRQAEQQVVAANARIGAAQALYFPLVQLTGSGGVQLTALNGAFFGPNALSSIGPSITLPLFNAGRIGAAVDSADARTQEAVLRYQQTIQQAFREVADALVGHEKSREFRLHQEALVATLRDALGLATMRYEGGVTSYLEVLDTERQRFQAELDLVRAQQNELGTVVLLYKALGGGWQTEAPLREPAATQEPPLRNVGLPAGEGGCVPPRASEAVRTVRATVADETPGLPPAPGGAPPALSGASAEGGGASQSAEDGGTWGSVKAFFRRLFAR